MSEENKKTNQFFENFRTNFIKGFRSMKLRIFVSMMVAGIVPAIIFRLSAGVLMEQEMVKGKIERILNQGNILRDQLISCKYFENGEYLFLEDELAQISAMYNGRVMVIGADFEIIEDTYVIDENKTIKEGEIPTEWEKPENVHKLEQKDTDARWTRKGNEVHFGYKNHVKCDADSKLITNYAVTDAAVHDSQRCTELLDDKEEALYADSAYSGAPIAENLPENCRNEICEKAQKGHPLTEEQKENNRRKSKIRCRIEHIFGFMTNSMHQITIRSIGITRAWFQIGLTNLVYNFCRYEFLKRPAA